MKIRPEVLNYLIKTTFGALLGALIMLMLLFYTSLGAGIPFAVKVGGTIFILIVTVAYFVSNIPRLFPRR